MYCFVWLYSCVSLIPGTITGLLQVLLDCLLLYELPPPVILMAAVVILRQDDTSEAHELEEEGELVAEEPMLHVYGGWFSLWKSPNNMKCRGNHEQLQYIVLEYALASRRRGYNCTK